MTEAADRRAAGRAKMEEVYGFSVDPDDVPGRFTTETVDHLFGSVWSGGDLTVAQRRLATIGVLAVLGRPDLLEVQFSAALANGELDELQMRDLVVHLAYYAGWAQATAVDTAAERAISKQGQ